VTGCSKKNNEDKEIPIPVEAIKVKTANIQREIELVGTLTAWKEADLAAQTTGRIDHIYVEEGSRVKEGDLLFEMDDTQLAQTRIQYQVAKDNFERIKPLYESGSISQSQYDQAKANFESIEKTYNMLLKNTQFRAPFSGIITAKRYNDGEIFLLTPTATGAPSVVTLMQINPLKLILNVSEANLREVKVGQNVEIQTDLYPGEIFKGKINNVNPAINPVSRTFQVEVKIPNSDERLKPGMFVRAKIFTGMTKGILIPRSAVLKQLGTSSFYAFVVNNNTAKRVDVQLGKELDAEIEVTKGINEGEILITKGQSLLKDGSKIEIKNKIE